MQPIIEEVNYDAKVEADSNILVVEVYDLDQAFQDKYYVEKKAMKWFLIRDYFDKKLTRWEPSRTPTPLGNLVFPAPINLSSNDESSDEFLRKLDEEVAKQKGEDK